MRAVASSHGEAGARGAAQGGASGHPDAARAEFAAFFAAQEHELLRFCWGLTLDRHDALDVAQEAMARAFRHWDSIAGTNPAGWVRTVALNIVRNRWRSRRRGDAAILRLKSRVTVASTSEAIHSGPTGGESLSAGVAEALRALPERQREAVVLHHMVDLSVAGVAEAMGVSEASVKTHLQRGRAALATRLGDEVRGGDDE